ncbi:MAG: hypothetical protein ACR2OB_14865 [Solirubrobacteraceae bacterium]
MARPSKFSAEKKQQIVLSVLRGELKTPRPSSSTILVELTQALGEAHVELRILKRGGVAGFATRSWR